MQSDGNSTALAQDFNFNELKEQRQNIRKRIEKEKNETDIATRQTNSVSLINDVRSWLATTTMEVRIDIQDPGIICVAISQIIATLLDLQESYELSPIEESTFLYYVYTIEKSSNTATPWLTEDGGKKLYLSDIFKKPPTGAILVIPVDIEYAFDINVLSLASAIEDCQAKIR